MRGVAERMHGVRRLQHAARGLVRERDALIPALVQTTGLSPEGVVLALTRHLEIEATDAQLAQFVDRAGHASQIAVVLAANVFVGALRAIAFACAASENVTVRPSRRDPTFARALIRAAIAEGDVGVRIDEALDVATLREGTIHVYGHDETIASIRKTAQVLVLGHGSGLGIAWVARSDDVDATARGLAQDVVVFDQRGCLSPRIVLVEGVAQANAFAAALHIELERLGQIVPRGPLTKEEQAATARYITTMTYANNAYRGTQHAIGIAMPDAPIVVLPPPHRTVHVAPCGGLTEASALIAPLTRGITNVGCQNINAGRQLAPPWARVSLVGEMQRPPLDGPVDLRKG
jgi:hypothetical protein